MLREGGFFVIRDEKPTPVTPVSKVLASVQSLL